MTKFKVGDRVISIGCEQCSSNKSKELLMSQKTIGVITHIKTRLYSQDTYLVRFDDSALSTWHYEQQELQKVEEEGSMTKNDLKTGMLVQTKDLRWWMIIKNAQQEDITQDIYILHKTNDWMPFVRWDDNLQMICTKGNYTLEKYTVIKVAKINAMTGFLRGDIVPEKLAGFRVIWERIGEKEQQLTAIITKLAQQMKEAELELEKIQGGK